MLVQLTARSVVLFERMALELQPGFNVLTGETGAGKSMIVDAFALVLGGRARPDIVRAGESEAEVEALFEIEPGSRVAAKLEAAGVPCAFEEGRGSSSIRRVVQAGEKKGEARSRAFVNGRLCTAGQLAELAADLCDVSSQHESVSLTDPATHMEYLDAFGKLGAERDALGVDVDALGTIVRELAEARAAERGRVEREDFLAYQLREIAELEPKLGEETELENERGRLRHAGRLADVDPSRGRTTLRRGGGHLRRARAHERRGRVGAPSWTLRWRPWRAPLESSRAELADAARALGRYAEGVESNPARLAEVEERAVPAPEAPAQARADDRGAPRPPRCAAEGAGDRRLGARIARRSSRRSATRSSPGSPRWRAGCPRSGARRQTSSPTRSAASSRRSGWGARAWSWTWRRPEAWPRRSPWTGLACTRSGIDRVEFLIAPNKGEDPRPLRRIASGGELSRALLALKRVLADRARPGSTCSTRSTPVSGGAVAEVIGRAIARRRPHRQVLCITHLPQIAALAETHFVVGKAEAKGRTNSTVRRLREDERVEELARMIGGVKVGDAARRAAEELVRARFVEK